MRNQVERFRENASCSEALSVTGADVSPACRKWQRSTDRVGGLDPRQVLDRGRGAARAWVQGVPTERRLALAYAFSAKVLNSYWQTLTAGNAPFDIRAVPEGVLVGRLDSTATRLAHDLGSAAALLEPIEAGYAIGLLYTALLPRELRGRHGIYYTPPALSRRLIAMASEAGVDWRHCRILDPACGGGAFLMPVALRMAHELRDCEPAAALRQICARLRGFEIDAFGAWMSQVMVDAALLDLSHSASLRPSQLVSICDSLEQEPHGEKFDLVIGNPPYGRTSLPPHLRNRYARSLFGHANLYGVFTDLALRWTRTGGVVAYVTPTSFLAGEYFKALRSVLAEHAPPVAIDFIVARKDVFEDVLQETMLATYRRGGKPTSAKVHFITATDANEATTSPAGEFTLPLRGEDPWVLPRTPADALLVARLQTMAYRLRDYGYKVSTGPLVWNRYKSQLRDESGERRYPLIWAESVTSDGEFAFRSQKRNHRPYFELLPGDEWLATDRPCVLVQRTTAKEQHRRLIAAELPADFIILHGKVVIENHLNMVRPANGLPAAETAAVAALLNSGIVDQAFRCISGSVAVSAFELEALPLPEPNQMRCLEGMLRHGVARAEVESAIRDMYMDAEA